MLRAVDQTVEIKIGHSFFTFAKILCRNFNQFQFEHLQNAQTGSQQWHKGQVGF
jgi:hypothetical protein